MITDYFGSGMTAPWQGRELWGTVLPASEGTDKGNVRVQVKLMKDKEDTFDNVPVLTGYGGTDHGAFFLPEEGDIVLLVFPGGDYRHPVVAGCRFPESSSFVKDVYQKENLKKAFLDKNGSGIFLSGEKGKDLIEIRGSEHMGLKLEEEPQSIVLGDREEKNYMLLDKKNRAVRVVSQSSIRLECGKSSLELGKDGAIVLSCEQLTLEAKTVQVQGKTKVQIKGQEVTLEGTMGVNVTGKGQLKMSSQGQLKLSGAMIHLN